MGLPAAEPDESYVTIILEVGTQVFGIVVDAVSDIVTLDWGTMQRPPELEMSVEESCLLGIIARDDSMMRVINTNVLFPRQVAAAA
jgi:purine-binding chemotaxis protein CheW